MLGASMSWSRGSFVSNRLSLPSDPFDATVDEMLGGGVVLVVAGLLAGEASSLDREAFQAGPLEVVTHQYANPLVAVALGALLLDERHGLTTLAGAALIVSAVAVTARYEGCAPEAVSPPAALRIEGQSEPAPECPGRAA